MDFQNEEHVKGGEKIRSFILGFNDGLISTFTLLVGVAAATLASTGSNAIVLLTGFAAMVSGAISMGLGEYISSKGGPVLPAQRDVWPAAQKEQVPLPQ